MTLLWTKADPRPIIPSLGRHYALTSDLAYLVVRLAAGLMLIPHGWTKVSSFGVAGVTGMLGKFGIPLPEFFAYVIMALETVGGIMIAIGFLTRPIAALLVIEFAVIVFVAHWPRGYSAGAGGIEFPLMWGLLFLAIALRGGGPWSVDRKLGWEI